MKKKLLLGFISVIILLILVDIIFDDFFYYHTTDPLRKDVSNPLLNDVDTYCYDERSYIHGFEELDYSREDGRPELGRSIFFHETSCFGEEGLILNARKACAVESAARMNPNMTAYLLILSPSKMSNTSELIIQQLLSYNNIRIKRINVDNYMQHTPLEKWFRGGILKTSKWPRSHMSDILRYLTLWKFGGIYLDLDIVVVKSLEDLENFVGAEDEETLNPAVIGFGMDKLGRKMSEACIKDLKKNFKGDIWGNNGPLVITRVLEELCATNDTLEMTTNRCDGFQVYPPSVFHPIYYKNWTRYFELAGKNETMEMFEKSRTIHVWNKFSKSGKIQVGSEVPYAKIAERFCPKVYNNCGAIF